MKPLPNDIQVFLVGGAVRDRLLNIQVKDRDWLVVGATPERMTQHGFIPVGNDFPVFLHPQTHEEYALARTERKSGRGYKGFTVYAAPDVTLDEDLARRDLTINAMAQSTDGNGEICLHDPFDGQGDLQRKILRHVGFAFQEDPLRILRLCRFAARFADFSIASETMTLMRQMVAAGEVRDLVPERVITELNKGLMEASPVRMFEVLRDCGALAELLPLLNDMWFCSDRNSDDKRGSHRFQHTMLALQYAAKKHAPLALRWACLMPDIEQTQKAQLCSKARGNTPAINKITPTQTEKTSKSQLHAKTPAQITQADLHKLTQHLKLQSDVSQLALLVAQERQNIHTSTALSADGVLCLLERSDALRRPERFKLAVWACECDAYAHKANASLPSNTRIMPNSIAPFSIDYLPRQYLQQAMHVTAQVNTAALAQEAKMRHLKGVEIGQLIHTARVAAIAAISN